MLTSILNPTIPLLSVLFLLIFYASTALGQGTEFTLRGALDDGGLPANGQYDFEFRLFDAETGGTDLATKQVLDVAVTSGSFTVRLDFGAGVFDGAARFLEIAFKLAGSTDPFTKLSPRQPVTSEPYAIRSLNATAADALSATCVGCVRDANIADLSGTKVTGEIPVTGVPAGSASYIQNGTSQQASSNFNISGDGTAGGTLSGTVVNAASHYNIGGNRVLSKAGTANLFAGVQAGLSNISGSGNSFFGNRAGRFNTSQSNNSFFGRSAGELNTANDNSFFGTFAGDSNTTGTRNSFFGRAAGDTNATGNDNAFFGYDAGRVNTESNNSFFGSKAGDSNIGGTRNAFFGTAAGAANVTGLSNSFFGYRAGFANTASNNSFFGESAGKSNTAGTTNSFFGNSAGTANTSGSNNSFFGSFAGLDNTTGEGNSFFGFGAGTENVSGAANSFFGRWAGRDNEGSRNSYFGNSAGANTTTGEDNSFFGYNAGTHNTTGKNNSFFGRNAGWRNTTGNENVFVGGGIGAALSGDTRTTGSRNVFVGYLSGSANVSGNNNTALGYRTGVGSDLNFATAIGSEAIVETDNTIVLGRKFSIGGDTVIIHGDLEVSRVKLSLASHGPTSVCFNSTFRLSHCSSSLRYKTGVQPFIGGLDVVRRLRPISFTWRDGGMRDVGFGAEEVEKIEPLLVTYNQQGNIEGVKYAQLSAALVNAIQQQQLLIEQQQRQIDSLKRLVCLSNSDADVCK